MKRKYESMTTGWFQLEMERPVLAGSVMNAVLEAKDVSVEEYQNTFDVCDFDKIEF